jgi:hypothetical protein
LQVTAMETIAKKHNRNFIPFFILIILSEFI